MMAFNLKKELTHLVIQHFQEENFNEAARALGRESGLFFDLKYFEKVVLDGDWDEAENYLSGFTQVLDNNHSIKMYFEIRKQKYFEALDENDHHKALDILVKDMKVFSVASATLMRDLSNLLTLDNIRQIKPTYTDAAAARKNLVRVLEEIMAQHPTLNNKLALPTIETQRLSNMLNDSLKWQKQQDPSQEPDLLNGYESSSISSTSVAANSGAGPFSLGKSIELNLTDGRPSLYERNTMDIFERLKSYVAEESAKKSEAVFDICNPSHFQFMLLPKHPDAKKIEKLVYTNAGNSLIALASNGANLVWLWPRTPLNSDGKASALVPCKLWKPKDGTPIMTNDLISALGRSPVSCLAISKKDGYIMSSSGGKVSLFNMVTFKTLKTFVSPPPAATCVAFYPQDNNIFGIGLDDSNILMYHSRDEKVVAKLEGHSKKVTALAFSNSSKILVSSDADCKIILWNTEEWKKLKERQLQLPIKLLQTEYETQIQFQPDKANFLFSHRSHLAIYEPTELTLVSQWLPESPMPIFQSTFSCSGHAVYSLFLDGTVAIFDASNLKLRCRLHTSSYLTPITSLRVYPHSIAAHPQKPNQFVVGHNDGSVYMFEPRNPIGDWIKIH